MFKWKRMILFSLMFLTILGCTDDVTIPEEITEALNCEISGYLIGGANLQATAYLLDSAVIESCMITAENGYFSFANIPRGYYEIRIISGDGLRRFYDKVELMSNYESLGEIYLKDVPEQIINIYPDTLKLIDTNTTQITDSFLTISVYFDEKMDSLSLVNAVSITPSIASFIRAEYVSAYNWLSIDIRNDTLFKTPDLIISIDSTAKDIYGQQIDFGFSLVYEIDTSINFVFKVDTTDTNVIDTTGDTTIIIDSIIPIISKTIPGDSTTLLDFNSSGFYIYFGSLVNQGNVENGLSIDPPVRIYVYWDTDTDPKFGSVSVARIVPADDVMTNTLFCVSIDSGTVLNNDITLDSTINLNFKTKPLKVSNTYPLYGQVDIPRDTTFKITFSEDCLKSSVAGNITITPLVQGFSFDSSHYYSDNIFFSTSDTLLQPNTEYLITIKKGVTDIYGNGMLDSTIIKFTTGQ